MYLDTTTGIVKKCHHAIFDEAWYLQPHRPPSAQLLYNLGLEAESNFVLLDGLLFPTPIGLVSPVTVTWPPLSGTTLKKIWTCPPLSLYSPIPLQVIKTPNTITATAARVHKQPTT
jgi:hypothetical protein